MCVLTWLKLVRRQSFAKWLKLRVKSVIIKVRGPFSLLFLLQSLKSYPIYPKFTFLGPGVVNSAMFAERAGFNVHRPLSKEHL
jgi:hypothetical protein